MAVDGDLVLRQLGQLGRDLDAGVNVLAELEDMAVDAEGAFRVKFARAHLDAEGNLEDRKQTAILICDPQWRTWGKASAAVRLQRESLKAIHARIDIGRTIASREKAAMALAGHDGAA